MSKGVKLFITLVIILGFVWFLVISPMITFHNNEKKMEDAARRYYEFNTNLLPTGERIKTIGLDKLYKDGFLDSDLDIPYSRKTCSIEDSWVKVRRENNEFRYYVYLKCGVLESNVDHKGPEIKLNGNNKITIGRGEGYKEPGVKSVIDDHDGKLKVENVSIKGSVDTEKVGNYEVKYSISDNLNNTTEVTREVVVVQKLDGIVKNDLNNSDNYVGAPENNYIRVSNMLFRIYGIDNDDNITIVADQDISNINYSKIDKWLDYYYAHLSDDLKKMIVEKKYCNMDLSESSLDTTQCTSYTNKRKVYIPSVIEVNKAQSGNDNFMKPKTMSWLSNKKNDKKAYLTRSFFMGVKEGKKYLAYNVNDNYGIRPMLTIKGTVLVNGGDGTETNPYLVGEYKKAKAGSLVNERFTGEYVSIRGNIYRIIEVDNDKTTKVISEKNIGSYLDKIKCYANKNSNNIVYDPKDKNSVAYFINNKMSEYVDTDYFVNHTVKVPVYKGKIIYGEEVNTKEYKVVLSAPNMYEMFSAQTKNINDSYGYWLINTSKKKRTTGAIYDLGVPYNEEVDKDTSLNIRVVGYLKNSVVVSKGKGTHEDPFVLK